MKQKGHQFYKFMSNLYKLENRKSWEYYTPNSLTLNFGLLLIQFIAIDKDTEIIYVTDLTEAQKTVRTC